MQWSSASLLLASACLVYAPAAVAQAPSPAPVAPPGAAARIEHIAIDVADLAKSATFYQSLFGLREIPATVKGPRWFDLGGGIQLHLIPGRTLPVTDNRRTHLALAVADVDSLMVALRRLKVPFTDFFGVPDRYLVARSDGAKQIFVADPDGYWIEVNDQIHTATK